jgi:hypothetical protein
MMDMISPFISLIFSWLNWTRAKHMVNRESSCSLGWSDRHGSGGNEVGSLQPIPGVARVQAECRAMRNLYAPNNFA